VFCMKTLRRLAPIPIFSRIEQPNGRSTWTSPCAG
jgi:hypothetical protein